MWSSTMMFDQIAALSCLQGWFSLHVEMTIPGIAILMFLNQQTVSKWNRIWDKYAMVKLQPFASAMELVTEYKKIGSMIKSRKDGAEHRPTANHSIYFTEKKGKIATSML